MVSNFPLEWDFDWALHANDNPYDPMMDELIQTSMVQDSDANTSYDSANRQIDSPVLQDSSSSPRSKPDICNCNKEIEELRSQFSRLQTDMQKVLSLLLTMDIKISS
ncbi:hypothetical protein F5884DRAFT_856644 [Xylogone sp. PMI_703]|nr:hypothetical protein F5884DRAFT_856644 [Xylogone sp. PMI_703]